MRVGKVLVGLSVLVLLGCQSAPEPPLTVSHPLFSSGFEQGLEGWEVEEGGPAVSVEPDSSVALAGGASVRLRGQDDSAFAILRAEEPIALEPDSIYAWSFSYTCSPAEEGAFPPAPSVRIMFSSLENEALTSEYRRFAAAPVTDGWARFSATFRSPSVPSVARPEIWIEKEQGTIWVDDVVFGLVEEAAGANLMRNGGFEQGQAGMAYDWVVYNPSPWMAQDFVSLSERLGAEGSYRRARRGARTGRHCLCLERGSEETREWLRCQQVVSLRGGETYLLSGWVKAREVEGSAFIVWQLAPSRINREVPAGEQVERGATAQVSGTAGWQQLETVLVVPKGAPTYALRLDLALIGLGKVWFDDIAVIHLPVVELVE